MNARALDQFYTRSDVAQRCMDWLRAEFTFGDDWLWLEPSAGSGAFFDLMPPAKIGLDIDPKHSALLRTDFLAWSPEAGSSPIVTLGNPPFGKNASLARQFFNHAAAFSDVVAMIVPRTFEKVSMQNKLSLHMHLRREHPLELDSFELDGESYPVPTVFQIWEKKDTAREIVRFEREHEDFAFVSKNEADFAFQRVGARAGLVSKEGLKKSPQSHYFLRANTCAETLMTALSSIDWDVIKWRTAGNPSIGKGELVNSYKAHIS